MLLCNAAQVKEMDRRAVEEAGIESTFLMSNAAAHIAAAATENLPVDGCVAVFCGTGNNGGDGIGAAAHLVEKGISVRVFLIGAESDLTADSASMLVRLRAGGGDIENYATSNETVEFVSNCDVIIDAMIGIGLKSNLRGAVLEATELINASDAYVISADIPTGVDADTGAIMGDAVSADRTVTFVLGKAGHFIEPGCIKRGELLICDIGIPSYIVDGSVAEKVHAVMPEDINLPIRRRDSHKGDHGRCFIVAGSVGYTGAPSLCARAASRMGAGLVYLGVPNKIYDIMAAKLEEEMPFPLPSDDAGRIAIGAASEISYMARECDVSLIGPGLGRSPEITEMLCSFIRTVEKPVVLDADGLNGISDNIDILKQAVGTIVLTPHPGEFARLGRNLSGKDRLSEACNFACEYNCVLVLKGHRTIAAFPDGTAFINTTGGPAMAKGGSGDVLAGMIAALIGQKFPIKTAVVSAVYIHGLAGDICADEFGEYSPIASDLINMIPKAVKMVMKL